jgi:hypothetical protein
MSTLTVSPQTVGEANCHSNVEGAVAEQDEQPFAAQAGRLFIVPPQCPVCGVLLEIA